MVSLLCLVLLVASADPARNESHVVVSGSADDRKSKAEDELSSIFGCEHIEHKIRKATNFGNNFVEGLLSGATLRLGALDGSVNPDR